MSVKEPSHRGQKRKEHDQEEKYGHNQALDHNLPHSGPPSTPRPDRFPSARRGVSFSVVMTDGQLCALKNFPPSGDFYFHSGLPSLTEIDLTSRLRHPSLLACEKLLASSPTTSDFPGLSLLFPLPAFDLYDALSAPLFPFAARFRLLEELFSAVAFLHSQGVLHLGLCLPAVTLSGPASAPLCSLGALEGALFVDDPEQGRRLPGPLLGAPDHLSPELLEQALAGEGKGQVSPPSRASSRFRRSPLSLPGEVPGARPRSEGPDSGVLEQTPRGASPRLAPAEGILYTGAADVWALGILSLYVLSGQGIFPCFAKGSAKKSTTSRAWQASVLSYCREHFSVGSREETVAHFLQAVPRKIRPRVNVPLLVSMLELDPKKRAKAQDLGSLLLPAAGSGNLSFIPRFSSTNSVSQTQSISQQSTLPPGQEGKITADFHNLNKLMILFLIHAYSGERMEVLFLAVDLLYRAALRFGPAISDEEQLVTAACCMFMAAKLVRETSKPEEESKPTAGGANLDVWGPSVHRAALVAAEQSGGEVTAHKILERELSLVEELGGVLYPMRWYHACRTRYQLSCVYEKVIRRPVEEYHKGFRSPEVLRREVEAEFGEGPEEMADLPQDKDLTIEEYFA